ncbi:HI1506-related protein [uncultured Paraglaciecola sp.]|uniref:HI1506-related protein n=1 Tax=uncultured Paraglaciecola sp. TaxID=1765024 RepID=UPI0026134BC5|nr:HI1506-related protein [uncultured Paraglaciecola sp.]
MPKATIALLIYASVATFRRAGHGFTDQGSAFNADHFSEKQLAAIHAEPRLSVKEVPIDAIPEGVDTSDLSVESVATAKADAKAKPEKAPAAKAKPAPAKE